MSIIENSIGISFDATQDFNDASILIPVDADNLSIMPVSSKNKNALWISYSHNNPITSQCFYHIIMIKHKKNRNSDTTSYTYLGIYLGFDVFYRKDIKS